MSRPAHESDPVRDQLRAQVAKLTEARPDYATLTTGALEQDVRVVVEEFGYRVRWAIHSDSVMPTGYELMRDWRNG